MRHANANPFYARRFMRPQSLRYEPETYKPTYAKLPRAPKSGSPVPRLTSLYHLDRAGEYGDRRYPGNCGGNLIKDLLRFFTPFSVFDPMSGSGTCRDVCRELGIYCWSEDIHEGFDLCDPAYFHGEGKLLACRTFDFCWLHPPYWRQDAKGIVTRQKLTKHWTDWIDYWSVDFDFENRREIIRVPKDVEAAAQGTLPGMRSAQKNLVEWEEVWTGDFIFENEWQSFRTKKDRKLELTSAAKEAPPGKKRVKIAVKVVDIFGNDTMTIIDVSLKR